jgi:acetylornithine deacetylase/succinyl-diaminopimelate desuccinylase-like protein
MNTIAGIDHSAQSCEFREYLAKLLLEICRLDTSIRPQVDDLRAAEHQVFDILERELKQYRMPGLRLERRPINPAIAQHHFFSQLYYTSTSDRPKGLSVQETYRDRCNLLVSIDGNAQRQEGVNQAINAHIDVVRPYIPPRLDGNTLFGRGACDDKGAVVAFMGAVKLLAEYLRQGGRSLNHDLLGMLVIEEEMGGNGSLSLAMDGGLRRHYDSLMVLECCSGRIHPGNRGAVWYKIELKPSAPWMNLLEASAFVIEELEREGRSIKAESRHDLFPHRPVQTCHGVIGPFGEHPSRINGRVDFALRFPGGKPEAVRALVQDLLDSALAEYIGLYGDKTKITGPDGKPKVHHHYDLLSAPDGFVVQVHGATGHMGSILENDGAITKMAAMIRTLLRSRAALQQAASALPHLELVNHADAEHLLMEGGQGFLPTHGMDEVMRRLTLAAKRGCESYARLLGHAGDLGGKEVVVTFDKLHNAAFAGQSDSADMRNAVAAARATGIWHEEPIRGWDVSCDARLFACEYPNLPVLTAGPGALACAHADSERVQISDIAQFAQFLAYFILQQTGTLGA